MRSLFKSLLTGLKNTKSIKVFFLTMIKIKLVKHPRETMKISMWAKRIIIKLSLAVRGRRAKSFNVSPSHLSSKVQQPGILIIDIFIHINFSVSIEQLDIYEHNKSYPDTILIFGTCNNASLLFDQVSNIYTIWSLVQGVIFGKSG